MMPSRSPISQWGRGSKAELPGLPPPTNLHVLAVVLAHGHGLIGDVGDEEKQLGELLVYLLDRGLHLLDPLGKPPHLRDLVGHGGLILHLGDLTGGPVLFGPQGLQLREDLAPPLVQLQHLVHGRVLVALPHGLSHQVRVLSDEL